MTQTTVRRLPQDKIDLVLGAGGVQGPAHIGVLSCLEERQVPIGTVTGASVGALIATFIANGYDSKQLKEIFLSESFRYPAWDIWSQCLRSPHPGLMFPPMTVDPASWVNYMLDISWPWVVDFKPWLKWVVNEYGLKPKENLRMVAADFPSRKGFVFTGTDYNLVDALAASTAAISGLGMRPVWYPSGLPHSHGSAECESMSGHLLIDGFYYHPIPADLSDRSPAIISKIGFATQLPSERLSPWDLLMHMREMSLAPFFNRSYPDPAGHIIIESGLPTVATTNFGVSQRTLEALVEHAYKAACQRLDREDFQSLTAVKK